MIYHKKYLRIKILLENVCKYELMGIYRPQAYLKGKKNYCTECQIELLKKPIEAGDTAVVNAVLFAPHGFGDDLKEGSLLHLQNGLNVEAKALVLEIMG
ncbi:hypothetical protein LDC_1083 [sediment metagenome]|uniref:Uncharacterized protein n=1 Tax=sediment metagenome TaxID=749907 RepID=D9PHT1_9ZZZZ